MLWGAPDQECQRRAVLVALLDQRRQRRALDGDDARLLGDIERGRGPVVEAILDQLEDALGARHTLGVDVNAILRLEHQEITVRHAHHRGERDQLAVEPARGRGEFRRAQQVAIASPEIDNIAGVERYGMNRACGGGRSAATVSGAGHVAGGIKGRQ